MSSLPRNNSPDKVDSHGLCIGDWIAEAFECYQVPPHLDQEVIDPLDEHTLHSCQSSYLGLANLKFDVLPATQVHFYKITRSEVSEPIYDIKLKRHLCSPIQVGNDSTIVLHDTDADHGCALFETPPLVMSQDESNHFPAVSPTPGNIIGTTTTTIALPPKKRKKRRIIRHSIIFTLAKDSDPRCDLSSLPTNGGTFYIFPQNALIDVMNDMAPFQIFCTFYLFKSSSSILQNSNTNSSIQYRTKLEEITTMYDSIHHRPVSTTPHNTSLQTQSEDPSSVDSKFQSINVEISNASGDIYDSLKEAVSSYQALCQKMAKLLYVHKQHLNEIISLRHHPSAPTLSNISRESTHLYTPAHDTAIEEKFDIAQHEEQHQNGFNVISPSNSTKRQYNKKKYDQQDDSKVTKRSYNKKKHNDIGISTIKADTDVKDYGTPTTTRKKYKRGSLSRDKTRSNSINGRRCFYCGVTETPMWRRGPDGGGTLCNACGVKWKNGKILSNEKMTSVVMGTSSMTDNNKSKRKPSTNDDIVKDHKRIKSMDDVKEPRLHEYTDASTLTDYHRQHDYMMNSLTMNTTKPITPTTMTTDDNSLRFSSSSNDRIYNSPPLVASSHSSTNSSPPISMDFQNHPMTQTGKLDGDAISLAPGVDDVEAAALLTLLSQS